jgi:hypothetical protein
MREPLVQGVVVEISYNIQAAVDNKHNLVVATHTINRNDLNALGAIALKQKKIWALPFWWIKATIMEGNCPMHK